MHLGAGFPQYLENLTGAIPRSQQKGNLDEPDRDTLAGWTNNRRDAKQRCMHGLRLASQPIGY